jgi:hypothetical protein
VHVQHRPAVKQDLYRKGISLQQTTTGAVTAELKKEKSHKYWHNTKVDTCSHIVIRGGVPLAVPAFQKPPKTYADNMPRSSFNKSIAREMQEQAVRPVSKAGDRYKPLEKYNPQAARNQLPEEPYVKPTGNVSQFQLGDQSSPDKKQFTSQHKNMVGSYKQPKPFAPLNPGYEAERVRAHHKWQNK